MLAHRSETKEPQQALIFLPAAALVYVESYLLQIQFQFVVLNLTDAIKKKKKKPPEKNDKTYLRIIFSSEKTFFYVTFTGLNRHLVSVQY